MSGSIRRLIAAAALALPPVFATCSKSTSAPKIPAPPSTVAHAYAGDHQIGLAGWEVNIRPVVRVTDSTASPISGATVAFAVTGGGGSGTSLVATTNAQGIAQVGSWVLGGSAGINTMTATATASGFASSQVTFSDTGYGAGYDIQIQYYGPAVSAAVQSALDSAVAKWQRLIYRPVGPAAVNVPGGTCGAGTPAINKTVTNLLILAKFDSIDGPGKILGQAGPCLVQQAPSQPFTVVGIMVFDTADVANMLINQTLGLVMLHEMGHVIGFGTLWRITATGFTNPNCLQLPDTIPSGAIHDTYFSCASARAAFDSVGGLAYTGAGQTTGGNKVPVENCGNAPYTSPNCGSGTVNGHWRETVFQNELMTGYINSGANPLSIVSVAAQADLGYVVNYAAADAYSHTFQAPAVRGGVPPLFLGDDIYHGPVYGVDATGRITRVLRR